jgi:hypothetical protein
MSRILAELLGVDEALFTMELRQLELAAGLPSHDVRLTAEIISKLNQKARHLGMDPRDTTGEELYTALTNLVQLHDSFLAAKLGIKDRADVAEVLPKVRQAALKADVPRQAWLLKPSVAKKLFKVHPPKRLMKYLGYKSLDSMLKRESVAELFVGVHLVESRSWLEGFLDGYESLSQMDFEVREVAILQLDAKRWSKAATVYVEKNRHIIMTVREMGVIAILPAPFSRRAGLTITVFMQLLHQIGEVRLHSAYYKLHQMQPNLGHIMARSLLKDEGTHLEVGGQSFHWRVAQRHFGSSPYHPEVLEPHVTADDLLWRKAEEVLYKMEPALHFWHEFDYVGAFYDGRPMSFNLMDVALNALNHIPYNKRLYGHMRDALWNELFQRYLGEPALEQAALKQLDYENDDVEDMLLIDLEIEVSS